METPPLIDEMLPRSLPKLHRDFLRGAIQSLTPRPWLLGIAASGSFATDSMDEYSDLDLTLVIDEEAYGAVLSDRKTIAGSLGLLLSAFTGEHVGEPRLLLCLYGPPILHVDFVFTTLAEAGRRMDEPVVLWDPTGQFTRALAQSPAVISHPDSQWFEERFWVWVHKAAGKIGRGELYEAIEYLAFLRKRVLGPLSLMDTGNRPNALRAIEELAPFWADALTTTLPRHNSPDCLRALRATAELYRRLRPEGVTPRCEVEAAVMAYLVDLESLGK